ncbi:MAG: DNA polymerase III subunit gamma/tau [Gemmatimonadota bacterium]|nr:DNA polymerase III subunit gamma/tau [Gemmatimonadota bacterium]
MPHIAFARKYRPRLFGDVTAQEHVSETLKRAIADDRVGHAYLFCGPRGVGKTTLARVLSMSLNCGDRAKDGEPCGACDSCNRIWSGKTALDVVEIDAASNRGVEDARQLRERAMYAPSQEGSHKVYIVDEAHMLTREAWNALLKILEEPPPRVIFVFATTEPQKIQQAVAPILSRCQRFDFHRIGVENIVERMEFVVESEGFSCPKEALTILARKADGGMRDALSVLDQVVALTGGTITLDSVNRILGLVEHERYLEITDIMIDRNHAKIFDFVQDLSDEGYDFVEFYHGLVGTLRNLLQLSLGGAPSNIDKGKVSSLEIRANKLKASDLVRMLSLATGLESSGSLKRNANLQLTVEMLLLRLSYMESTVEIEELLGNLPQVTHGDVDRGDDKPHDHSAHSDTEILDEVAPEKGIVLGSSAIDKVTNEESTGQGSFPEEWTRLIAEIKGVPQGGKPFLRACRAYEGKNGEFVIHGPSEDVIEKIKEERSRIAIEKQLNQVFSGNVKIVYVADNKKDLQDRNGQDSEERLTALIEKDPNLEQVVKELNLELLD